MTSVRSPLLEDFLNALRNFVSNGVGQDERAGRAADRIFSRLNTLPVIEPPAPPRRFPVCDRMDQALEEIPLDNPDSLALGQALKALDPKIPWYRRPEAEKAGQEFVAGHANAMIVGPEGIERRNDVLIGVSLMAPHVTYPNHNHPPEEIYAVLSPGEWRQADGPWWAPGIGGMLYNPPNIVHAMRSGDRCLLAVWALWAA